MTNKQKKQLVFSSQKLKPDRTWGVFFPSLAVVFVADKNVSAKDILTNRIFFKKEALFNPWSPKTFQFWLLARDWRERKTHQTNKWKEHQLNKYPMSICSSVLWGKWSLWWKPFITLAGDTQNPANTCLCTQGTWTTPSHITNCVKKQCVKNNGVQRGRNHPTDPWDPLKARSHIFKKKKKAETKKKYICS